MLRIFICVLIFDAVIKIDGSSYSSEEKLDSSRSSFNAITSISGSTESKNQQHIHRYNNAPTTFTQYNQNPSHTGDDVNTGYLNPPQQQNNGGYNLNPVDKTIDPESPLVTGAGNLDIRSSTGNSYAPLAHSDGYASGTAVPIYQEARQSGVPGNSQESHSPHVNEYQPNGYSGITPGGYTYGNRYEQPSYPSRNVNENIASVYPAVNSDYPYSTQSGYGQQNTPNEHHNHNQEYQPNIPNEHHNHNKGYQPNTPNEHHNQGYQPNTPNEHHNHNQGYQPNTPNEHHHHNQGYQPNTPNEHHHHNQGYQPNTPNVYHNHNHEYQENTPNEHHNHNHGFQGNRGYSTHDHSLKENTEYKEVGHHVGPFQGTNPQFGYGSGYGSYNGAFNRPGF